MKVCVVTPAPRHSRTGNRVTAFRWARILRDLGHKTIVREDYDGRPCDLLVALHARRSFASVQRFVSEHPDRHVIVALTGTDLYGDIQTDPSAQRALELAWRLVVLQPKGLEELTEPLHKKTRVILQSVQPLRKAVSPRKGVFEVCVLGHLRPVKDPFRAALAARLLPASSRIRIVHLGAALTEEMEQRARTEVRNNPRYCWLGELPRWKALRVLARSRVLVLSSLSEGGANAVSEALAHSVPVVASRIPGSVGLLGEDYPGCFPATDTEALASILRRIEMDATFYESLRAWCHRLAPLVHPARERASWAALLEETSAALEEEHGRIDASEAIAAHPR